MNINKLIVLLSSPVFHAIRFAIIDACRAPCLSIIHYSIKRTSRPNLAHLSRTFLQTYYHSSSVPVLFSIPRLASRWLLHFTGCKWSAMLLANFLLKRNINNNANKIYKSRTSLNDCVWLTKKKYPSGRLSLFSFEYSSVGVKHQAQ